ncbi:MAG TPA: T9SS type A sorting domain-containing protein, partial [Chitinophagales bacterium]|nr:T9SS type A sorting domain-containing protein [Chitinophagales bacterium]
YMDTTENLIRDFLYANVDCDETLISGITTVQESIAVSVFPNPASDVINIQSQYDKDLTAEVFSVEGKLLWQKTLAGGGKQTITRSELGTGTFMLRITSRETNANRIERLVFY